MSGKSITIKQIKSAIGRHNSHQACLRGLGIRRMHQSVTVCATPENLGMINKISYLLKIED
jgi:large subunit ribosomal protein L30